MTRSGPGTRNPQINTLLLPIGNSSPQEHICSDGYPDWGDGTDCLNCSGSSGMEGYLNQLRLAEPSRAESRPRPKRGKNVHG